MNQPQQPQQQMAMPAFASVQMPGPLPVAPIRDKVTLLLEVLVACRGLVTEVEGGVNGTTVTITKDAKTVAETILLHTESRLETLLKDDTAWADFQGPVPDAQRETERVAKDREAFVHAKNVDYQVHMKQCEANIAIAGANQLESLRKMAAEDFKRQPFWKRWLGLCKPAVDIKAVLAEAAKVPHP